MLSGTENKQGWINRYNLETSPSTRNRHKKEKPVFDLVLFGAVNSDFDRELIELPDLENLGNNDFSMCKIWACLVVTFPKHFYKIKENGTALYDLSNAGHIDQINKRIKAKIPNAERFRDIRGMTVFDTYMFEKRKPKITDIRLFNIKSLMRNNKNKKIFNCFSVKKLSYLFRSMFKYIHDI